MTLLLPCFEIILQKQRFELLTEGQEKYCHLSSVNLLQLFKWPENDSYRPSDEGQLWKLVAKLLPGLGWPRNKGQ